MHTIPAFSDIPALNIPVESLSAFEAINAKGQKVHVQSFPVDGVLRGVRENEGLAEYAVLADDGQTHLFHADSAKRATDLVRFALNLRPLSAPELVDAEPALHPNCR